MKFGKEEAILLCLIIFGFIIISHLYFGEGSLYSLYIGSDKLAHFQMANGTAGVEHAQYAPFWKTVSAPFSVNYRTYFTFAATLIFLGIPIFFGWLLKNYLFTLFYFAVSFPFRMELMGAYPQMMISLLLVMFLLVKNNKVRFAMLVVAPLIHGWGFHMILFAWGVSILWDYLREKIVLGCFPVAGESIAPLNDAKLGLASSLGDIVRLFGRDLNIILVLVALKGFIKKKRVDIIIVGLAFFVMGVIVHLRVWVTLMIIAVVGVTWGYKYLPAWQKKGVVGLSVLLICLHCFTWFFDTMVNYSWGCP